MNPLARLEIWLPGRPKTKDRPRAAVSKGGKPFMYTTQKTAKAEAIIREKADIWKERQGITGLHTGPVHLRAYFLVQKPKNFFPGRRPQSQNYGDLDNLLKTVKDALNGVLYKDDSQICRYDRVEKMFHDRPGTLVVLELYPEAEKASKKQLTVM